MIGGVVPTAATMRAGIAKQPSVERCLMLGLYIDLGLDCLEGATASYEKSPIEIYGAFS